MKSLIEKPKPGMFQAVCRMTEPVEWAVLTIEQRDVVETLEIPARRLGALQVVDLPCSFETTEQAELEQHMKLHGGGRYRWDNGSLGVPVREVRNYSPKTPRPVPMWRSPKLTDEGKPFEPTGLEVGSRVEWDGRTGQVWCLGGPAKSVWVVPDEPSVQDRTADGVGIRHELATLLVALPSGKLSEHQTSWSSWKTQAA